MELQVFKYFREPLVLVLERRRSESKNLLVLPG
jgi:hypothetical protein